MPFEGDIFDKNIAFGLMPFETIYFDKAKPHLLEEHYKRFKRACRIFKIKFEYDFYEYRALIEEFIKNLGEANGVLKIAVFKERLIINYRRPSYDKRMYESGLRLNLSKVVRDRENILSYFKTFNYGINYLEDLRAKNKNYEGALFLNNQGNICETSYANIFLKSENTIYTPHIRNGILNGVMRRLVIAKALEMGYEVRKTNITIRELNNFEECFITNSIAGVIPVKSINNYMFASRKFASLINKEEILKRSWN